MHKFNTIGLDTAKNVFHLVACDRHGKVVAKKRLTRKKLLDYFAHLPECLIGIEACSASHHWGRELRKLGHDVKLIPAQHVKAFVRGNKHDYNDARAIAEAVGRPEMHFVAIKTTEQQDQALLNQQRQAAVREHTRQCNSIRAMLTERGVASNKGVGALRRSLPELLENTTGRFSPGFITILQREYDWLQQLGQRLAAYDEQLKTASKQSPACQRLGDIPGFGPVVSSYFASEIGDGRQYSKGREVSASLGIVPAQHSSGGKQRLLGISKRGNPRLRSLLIHGARSVVSNIGHKQDPLSCWIRQLVERVGIHKATVAYANKMARIGWAVLRHNTEYQPGYTNPVTT